MNSTPDAPSRPALRTLTPLEARVLGVLVEKQHTVPDAYPLSVNALTSGCNQKTARAPVMNVTEADVLTTIDDLKRLSLVFEGSSSRVPRFEHNMNRVLGIPSQAAALLTTLILRGPQTAAELRLNAARLHGFADISSVEAFLDELAANEPARVVKLPRTPGERESRWAHLLCGEVSVSGSSSAPWWSRWLPSWGSPSTRPPASPEYYAMRLGDGIAYIHIVVNPPRRPALYTR
jgi:uncharacterized protein YceH (UPF0502 family)